MTMYLLVLLILHIMKKFIITSILLALFYSGSMLMAQDQREQYLGLPGDNLNLYAVMKLFQQSKTLEEFERNLNDPKNNINNLDLNGDGLVDYIKVFDDPDGDVHNIVLQVAVSPRENQDVAVFSVQRFNNGQIQIQLTGDEELYGKNYIIEPIYDDGYSGETANPGYTGSNITYVKTTPYQVAAWPIVRFVFLPTYSVWRSPWYWGYYPEYWHPWNQYSWHYYYGYHYNWDRDYYEHYRRWDYHRYSRWNDFYYSSRRTYSHDVNHRIEAGYYKSTYSHPEQRKDGETMFAKTHPNQYIRTSEINNTVRRTYSHPNNGIQYNSNVGNENHRTGNDNSVNRNTSDTRRSSSSVTSRNVANHPGDNNSGNRNSSTMVVRRSATNSNSGQNAGSGRSSNTQKSTTVSSSNRKAEGKNKSESAVKKDSKSKESENKDNNRRR
jgi:hypothetical protein